LAQAPASMGCHASRKVESKDNHHLHGNVFCGFYRLTGRATADVHDVPASQDAPSLVVTTFSRGDWMQAMEHLGGGWVRIGSPSRAKGLCTQLYHIHGTDRMWTQIDAPPDLSGFWQLRGTSSANARNHRVGGNRHSIVVATFQEGDWIEAVEDLDDDWVRIGAPSRVKGLCTRLRDGMGRRIWTRINNPPPRTDPGPPPSSWTSANGVHIVPDNARVTDMQKLVSATWQVRYTKDRGRGSSVPTGARVLSVLRVENHEALGKYRCHVSDLKARRINEDIPPFTVATRGLLSEDLDATVNEMYLFHGTTPEAGDAIARTVFDVRRAGSAVGSMFGPGIYLAENASKSDEYAKEGSGVFAGQYALLVCRAVAGKVFTAQDGGDYSPKVRSGHHDSVCGDRAAAVGTFREMIFFESSSVYCEFIITYLREYCCVSNV